MSGMKLEKTTTIRASAAAVYQTLMDFAAYGEWNPMVTAISGDANVDGVLSVTIKMGKMKPQVFKPVVLRNEPNQEFRWVGVMGATWLIRGEHYFIIRPQSGAEGEGGAEAAAQEGRVDGECCTFVHGETFSGVMSVAMRLLNKEAQKSFQAFNDALKTRVESQLVDATDAQ